MKPFLILSLSLLSSCAATAPPDESASFEAMYTALSTDQVLTDIDAATGPGIQLEYEQAALQRGQPLNAEQKDRLKEEIKVALSKRGGIDHAAAKRAFRASIMSRLSAADMQRAAAFYSTPEGKRIHVAVIEGEKAVSKYLEEADPTRLPLNLQFPAQK